jgi:hypothetical protein
MFLEANCPQAAETDCYFKDVEFFHPYSNGYRSYGSFQIYSEITLRRVAAGR